MPHKRAKLSTRQEQRTQQGSDNAPRSGSTISTEGVPKSALRVLNAAQVRTAFRARKRGAEDGGNADGGPSSSKKRRKKDASGSAEGAGAGAKSAGSKKAKEREPTLTIHPGESLAQFNRRVEDSMRGAVRTAVRASSTHGRKTRKTELEDAAAPSSSSKRKSAGSKPEPDPGSDDDEAPPASTLPPKDFAMATPRRVNDVAQAPPELRTLKKASKLGVVGGAAAKAKAAGVLSMAQRSMMEAERERAIHRYRELKAQRAAAGEGARASGGGDDGTT